MIEQPALQRQDTSSPKFRLLRRRRRAAWDDDYLTQNLNLQPAGLMRLL
jgi:hypothetical protein